ncbi:S8 family peptidase [Corynebacterium imitans]|uniref:S8 family peptidase n=1 Tax=Corynebacterium imitans TaxID=156978 RepID=UPI00254F5B6D|nr:S8 family peptidase [Corynebacterium imitans]MDK8306472.1 S8 family peptidase [Corynebacterium imitans]
MNRGLDHLYVEGHAVDANLNRKAGARNSRVRDVDRRAHGTRLRDEAARALDRSGEHEVGTLPSDEELRATGTIIVLEGEGSAYPLQIDSLNAYVGGRRRKPKWLLLSVRGGQGGQPEKATVWVSDSYRAQFLAIFEDYLNDAKNSPKGLPKRQTLVANISRIREAVLEDLWTSESQPQKSDYQWWELWLDAGNEHIAAWERFISVSELEVRQGGFRLGDRLVVWVKAKWEQLQLLPFMAVPLTEIREPQFIDTVEDLSIDEQTEYVQDLACRTIRPHKAAPSVCVLDTGVLRTHVLLKDALDPTDHHSIFDGTGTDVHPNGHGTAMAGLALFGNIDPLLIGKNALSLRHRLESVRMYSGNGEGQIDPIDYGTATTEAVAIPEITHSDGKRAFCLALSTEPDSPGEPTLWSASVDALAAGVEISREGDELQLLSTPEHDSSRLFVVAAGNVTSWATDYRTNSQNSPIQDPAQAWNALTVGAYTELTHGPSHPQYAGWKTVAASGDISPHTTTSLHFDTHRWPIKPDICMEGGNVLTDGAGMFEPKIPSLSLRTTGHRTNAALVSANATSAATAQASRLAALAMERYPSYWPETVRGLLPHVAEWTDSMRQQLDAETTKNGRQMLLRQFGWGVPSQEAVLNSARSAVTLVTQDTFVPFSGSDFSMRQFRLHELPWPTDVLQSLGEAEVRLRITLSYFIEPSASRRGWKNKYQYASHGLRFDLQGRMENQAEFIQRVNRNAGNEESGAKSNESGRWFLGERGRHRGSLHQDEWIGTGAELAHCNNVAVYPVGGWWKKNSRKDRRELPVRYALLISLKTQEQEVDLYTPIATQLQIPVPTTITT